MFHQAGHGASKCLCYAPGTGAGTARQPECLRSLFMNPAFTLHRLSVVTLLTLAAPGLLAQATTPLTRVTAPSVATAKPPVPSLPR